MEFDNVYEDSKRAEAYAKLEFPGTYYLAYRDLPEIISEHIKGRKALDFGCGAGRSTRYLKKIGFDVTGVDISEPMLEQARAKDRGGKYQLIKDGDLSRFKKSAYDLVLSAFTFDNIRTAEERSKILRAVKSILKSDGRIINLVSAPEIYKHEWASFTTKDFPENRKAKSGDKVKIIMTDVEDQRPVEDILWSDESYKKIYKQTGLGLIKTYKPLANESEPYEWVNETKIAPWVVYVLKLTCPR